MKCHTYNFHLIGNYALAADFGGKERGDEFGETGGKEREEPDRKSHRPGEGDESDIAGDTVEDDSGGAVGFHEKRHGTGIRVGDARTDESRTHHVDAYPFLLQHSAQGESPGFDAGLRPRIRRTPRKRRVSGDGSGKDEVRGRE